MDMIYPVKVIIGKEEQKQIISVRYGTQHAHKVNIAWFDILNIKTRIPFNFFKSRNMLKLGAWNQAISYLYSFFIPSADIYLLTSTGCTPAIIYQKQKTKSKIIAINSDTFYVDLIKAKGIKKKYMTWLASKIDGMISTSEMMRKIAEKQVNIPHEVVYPFCNVEKFSKIKPNLNNPNICSIGTGINTKGTDILFKVFELYHKEFPNSTLYVCGYKDKISKLAIPKATKLPGNVDPITYLSNCGIYINTSRHESFGVNILEAMCAGIPPLVTKYCGAAEIVKQVDPWLVTSLDPREIAKKAIILQKNIEKKKELGAKCRKIALKLTQKKSSETFKNKFHKILNQLDHKSKSIVIIAPHPDDEWIGCGCTILKSLTENITIKVLLITRNERTKKRVDSSKKLAKKYGYSLKILGEDELKIDCAKLRKFLKKEINPNEIVYIPDYDSHPDHQLINNIAKEVLENNNVNRIWEYAVYNNSKKIWRLAINKTKSVITKKGYPSFQQGTHTLKMKFELNTKNKYISNLFNEKPRAEDTLRCIYLKTQ